MIKSIKRYIRKKLTRLLNIENNDQYLERLKGRGLKVGVNFNMQKDVILDDSHCWLIEIGDNVTMAPRVHVLCHDASTKHHIDYTSIGKVFIGDNVFIGANSIIMPSVSIGSNSIVGANSIVTKDIDENTVVYGSPAKFVCSVEEYISKSKQDMSKSPLFDESYTLRKNIDNSKKAKMIKLIEDSETKKGFIE